MKDGLHLPSDAAYTDAVSLSRLLSFGPYDSLLASWHRPVKVVSSMGKQSSGKSYLLNHLSGSLLNISGGRCTDGVWMTMREAEGCLYVLLDFEGMRTVDRTEQDMLLSVLNAAISSLTIFNKRVSLGLSQSFSQGRACPSPSHKTSRGLVRGTGAGQVL